MINTRVSITTLVVTICLLPLVQSLSKIKISNNTFPDDFILGVSTAAFQIEGGWNEDGKGESMWDTYLHNNPNFTVDHSNGDVATDSYHLYKDDIRIIRELGVKHYRLSISWSRILPQGTDNKINKHGIKYYRNLFQELLNVNVTPVVTLFHWDLPTRLMDLGGWANPKIVDYFEDYARVAFNHFGDIVKTWTTLNEPQQHCYNGYGRDYFVPALMSHGIGEYLCTHYMLLGHSRVYRMYEREYKENQKGIVGITIDMFWADPKDPSKLEDKDAAERYMQFHVGLYANPIFSKTGDYPEMVRQRIDKMSAIQGFSRSRLPYFNKTEIQQIKGSSDFLGLNHYTTFIMSPTDNDPTWKVPSMDHDVGVKIEQNLNWPKPGADWFSIHPQGFRNTLNWLTEKYGKKIPIIVTENGMSDFGDIEDYDRVEYFNDYMYQMLLAMYEDGCNIAGYFAWTLMDDFEWLDGYTSKFGLYHVDLESPNKTRTPKLSALNYKEIVRTRSINFDFIRRPSYNEITDNDVNKKIKLNKL